MNTFSFLRCVNMLAMPTVNEMMSSINEISLLDYNSVAYFTAASPTS